jgi:hypothetical protein
MVASPVAFDNKRCLRVDMRGVAIERIMLQTGRSLRVTIAKAAHRRYLIIHPPSNASSWHSPRADR